jgi:hypothetical protein
MSVRVVGGPLAEVGRGGGKQAMVEMEVATFG